MGEAITVTGSKCQVLLYTLHTIARRGGCDDLDGKVSPPEAHCCGCCPGTYKQFGAILVKGDWFGPRRGLAMPDFYAVKHLAGSDLAWFRSLLRAFANTNLKGINLNADPTTTIFYPDLAALAEAEGGRVRVDTTIYGPAAAQAAIDNFKIVRSPGSKNWRLNGTLVNDPIGEEGRFNVLQRDDLAVLAFTGRGKPRHVQLVLLASQASEDTALVDYFRRAFPKRPPKTMHPIEADDILEALKLTGVPNDHPLRFLVLSPEDADLVEDAALGGSAGIIARRRGQRPRVSAKEITSRRTAAESVGREGEALLNGYFDRIGVDFEWTAEPEHGDGFAPFDFDIRGGPLAGRVDAKTTQGPFERAFHLSLGEIVEAAESQLAFRIARIYLLGGDGARMRISDDISRLAQRLLSAHDAAMFGGIKADAFTVPTDAEGLIWSDEIILPPLDAEDG